MRLTGKRASSRISEEVGDGDLGGGDEPVVVVFEFAACDGFRIGIAAAEEVFRKLWELPGSEEAL